MSCGISRSEGAREEDAEPPAAEAATGTEP